jgi:hypothetical protein
MPAKGKNARIRPPAAGRAWPLKEKRRVCASGYIAPAAESVSCSAMDERQTARLVGIALGMIFACVMVLNALAGY